MQEQIERYINRFVDAHELPGLAVGVVKDGKTMLAEGYGVRSVDTRERVTKTSLFHMASVSKPFTANAIMQLVEKGLVDLNSPVIRYVPYFKIDDDRYKGITVQQMLSHVSGMPDVMDYEWETPYAEDDAMEKYVRSLTDLKLKFEPGTAFAYSNIAFEILGDLIAKVTGLAFEEAIKRNIFEPLGMKDSTFLRAEVPEGQRMTPHIRHFENQVGPVYPYNRAHAPSSTLHSCAVDMCKWMLANINRGSNEKGRILQASSYDLLWKEYFQADQDSIVGLSWMKGDYKGFVTIGHGGSDDGFRSQLTMIPDERLGVTVMSNLNPAPVDDLVRGILDILLGFSPVIPLKPVVYEVGKTYKKDGYQTALKQLMDIRGMEDVYDYDVESFMMIGFSLAQAEKPDQALDIINLGLALEPASAGLHASLAFAYHIWGELEKSQEYLEKALALAPEDMIVNYIKNMIQ